MNDWREVRLGDICEIYDGPHATPPKTDSGKIFLGISSLGFDGRINSSHFEYVSEEVFKKWTRRIEPKYQDIVFSYETKLGVAAMIPVGFKCCLGRRMGLLRPKDGVEPRFLIYAYLAPEFQKVIHERTYHGSTVDRIPLKEMSDFPVSIPDLAEQKAIASVLSSLDDKIDLLHRQNKTLDAMAETLFRQWFVEEVEVDWEDSILERHVEVFRGLSYKGNGLTENGSGLPMHNLNSVNEGGGYKYSGIKFYSGDFKERHLINVGDIIVANTEQGHEFKLIGFPAIVPAHFGEKGIFSQHIYRLIPKITSYLTSEYLYYLLINPLVREQVISATNGSTVNMLAIDGLNRPKFKLPPAEKVLKFTSIIQCCWKKKENNYFQIRTLETLRDTLLPKLMSGEVRVDYP